MAGATFHYMDFCIVPLRPKSLPKVQSRMLRTALQHLDGIVAWAVWAVERKLMSADMLCATSTRKGASAAGQSLLGAAEHFLALLLPGAAQLDTLEGGAATQVFGLGRHCHSCCIAAVVVPLTAECGRAPFRRPQLCRDYGI